MFLCPDEMVLGTHGLWEDFWEFLLALRMHAPDSQESHRQSDLPGLVHRHCHTGAVLPNKTSSPGPGREHSSIHVTKLLFPTPESGSLDGMLLGCVTPQDVECDCAQQKHCCKQSSALALFTWLL